jgi:hypothetical protein
MYNYVIGLQSGNAFFFGIRDEVEEIPDYSNVTTETGCLL